MKQFTLAEIVVANKKAGGHFFDPCNMAAFQSRIESSVAHCGIDGVFFVTSEVVDAADAIERSYNIREFDRMTGAIKTFGVYGKMKWLHDAGHYAAWAPKDRTAALAAMKLWYGEIQP